MEGADPRCYGDAQMWSESLAQLQQLICRSNRRQRRGDWPWWSGEVEPPLVLPLFQDIAVKDVVTGQFRTNIKTVKIS